MARDARSARARSRAAAGEALIVRRHSQQRVPRHHVQRQHGRRPREWRRENTDGIVLFQADGNVGDFVFDVHVWNDTFIRSAMRPMQRGDGFSGAQNTTVDHSIFYDG